METNNNTNEKKDLSVSEDKTKMMVQKYEADDNKGEMTREEYARHLKKNDPNFVPWLFNFEQREGRSDLSTGMWRDVDDAFDNWIDIYNNY